LSNTQAPPVRWFASLATDKKKTPTGHRTLLSLSAMIAATAAVD
jgi:hypothetical protein